MTLALVSCDKVPLTAPSGSNVTLSVNSTSMPLNGTAQLTAIVIEAAGTAPQNGTVVTFTTTLGSVDPREARTVNGQAVTTFRSGTTSGTARLTAISGDATSEVVELLIGGAAASAVLLRTEPGSAPNAVDVVATVIDSGGNPVRGVTVSFSATSGIATPGAATTNDAGEARTTVTAFGESTVTARAGGQTATITISSAAVTLALTNPAALPEAGVPTSFTVTPPASGTLREVVIDFGDNTPPLNLGAVTGPRTFNHTFARAGNYTVTARSTSAQGNPSTTTLPLQVFDSVPVPVTVGASPNPVGVGVPTTLTATATVAAPDAVRSYEWTFGDGTTAETTGPTVPKSYSVPLRFNVQVRVTTVLGRSGNGQVTVTVQ